MVKKVYHLLLRYHMNSGLCRWYRVMQTVSHHWRLMLCISPQQVSGGEEFVQHLPFYNISCLLAHKDLLTSQVCAA